MRPGHLFPNAFALLLTPVLGFSQTSVWTVDDDGPADFATIGEAVAASSDGDAILVRGGSYPSFTLDARGVTVVGEPDVTYVHGHVQIENLAPGQVAVLSSLAVRSTDHEAIRAHDNQGSIRLQSCELFHYWNHDDDRGHGALIVDSDDVCLVDCVLRGGVGTYVDYWWYAPGGAGAVIEHSTIALYDCDVRGGDGGDNDFEKWEAGDAGPGGVVVESFLFLSNSPFTGGDGGDLLDFWNTSSGGDGGAGMDLKDLASELQILHSPISGGEGGTSDGLGSSGSPGPPFTGSGASLIVQLSGTRRQMEVTRHCQPVGTTLLATFRGLPGDTVYLPVDRGTAFTFDVTVKGAWILPQPPSIPPTPIALIPASGEIQVELPSTVPTGGNVAEVEFRQMWVFSQAGETLLGSPTGTLQIACSAPLTYCVGAPNSVGPGAAISLTGSVSVFVNDALLNATGTPPDQFGLFFYGPNQIQIPFGDGFRCVGGGVYRLGAVISDASGYAFDVLDYTQPPMNAGSGHVSPGDSWNFQYWYRDPSGPGGTGSNTSNALAVTFCP